MEEHRDRPRPGTSNPRAQWMDMAPAHAHGIQWHHSITARRRSAVVAVPDRGVPSMGEIVCRVSRLVNPDAR